MPVIQAIAGYKKNEHSGRSLLQDPNGILVSGNFAIRMYDKQFFRILRQRYEDINSLLLITSRKKNIGATYVKTQQRQTGRFLLLRALALPTRISSSRQL